MVELIYRFPEVIRAGELAYRARVYGEREARGGWGGYVVFVPVTGGRAVATDRETTQHTLEALDRWAGSLSWVYLEGALSRALERQPEIQLSRRLAEIEQAEAAARAEADALEQAAARARDDAEAARLERDRTAGELARTTARATEALAEFHERAAAEARTIATETRRADRRRIRPSKRR